MTPPPPILRIGDLRPQLPRIGFRARATGPSCSARTVAIAETAAGMTPCNDNEAPANEMIFDNHPFHGALLHVRAPTPPSAITL